MAVKLIAFDSGWVLFRPGNWEILHKHKFTDEEGYWLIREIFGRANDWILLQIKKKKTSNQIIESLQKYYPKQIELLERVRPILKQLVSIDFIENIKLGYELKKSGYQVEIWSDNGLGRPDKNVDYQSSETGLIPEFKSNHILYKKYPSVHVALEVPAYYSKDLGVLKRNPLFFEKILFRHKNIKPEEVIFIEDRAKNIMSAKSLGIKCIQFIAKTNERETVENVPIAHTTKQLIKELQKFQVKIG